MSIQARAMQYGKLFGNWKIRDFIGEGSQGKTGVFRIIKSHEDFKDESALKVVTVIREDGWPEDLTDETRQEYQANKAALCAQAVNEVKLMKRLAGNPYVVSYQNWEFCDWEESGQFGCDLLIQMPMLVTLRKLQKTEGYFSNEEIRRVGHDICTALIRCGEEGILHRDIKPANIFLEPEKKENYMLGDFGISRIVESGLDGASTTVGTLDYAAPEQFSSGYDSRVDIYSLGLTLYELANQNHLPFWKPGCSNIEAVKQRLSGSELPPPSQADPELAEVILKACAFNPEDRYQTAEEFLTALNRLVSQPEPYRSKVTQEPLRSIDLRTDDESASADKEISCEPTKKGQKVEVIELTIQPQDKFDRLKTRIMIEEDVAQHHPHGGFQKQKTAIREKTYEESARSKVDPAPKKRKFVVIGIAVVAVFIIGLITVVLPFLGKDTQHIETPAPEDTQRIETPAPEDTQRIETPAPEDTQRIETPAPEDTQLSFDSRLVGRWSRYDRNNDGDIKGVLAVIDGQMGFLHDGTFFDGYNLPFDEAYVIGGLEPLVISAENGEMDFGAKWLSYLVQNGAIEQAEADKYSEISVTYEIFDITGDEAEKIIAPIGLEGLSNYSDDGLRVHVTGSYQENPVTKQTIDFTYCYYKRYHSQDFMEAYLVGSWEDNAGNKWNFTYQEGENSRPDFVYSMTDTNGTEYLSKRGSYLEYGSGVKANELGYIRFKFESFYSPWYEVESIQANTISFVSDSGNIILTRQ